MTFFARMAERSLGSAPRVRPRMPARFESLPERLESEEPEVLSPSLADHDQDTKQEEHIVYDRPKPEGPPKLSLPATVQERQPSTVSNDDTRAQIAPTDAGNGQSDGAVRSRERPVAPMSGGADEPARAPETDTPHPVVSSASIPKATNADTFLTGQQEASAERAIAPAEIRKIPHAVEATSAPVLPPSSPVPRSARFDQHKTDPASTTVRISIGRLEIRADPPRERQPPARQRRAPAVDLSERLTRKRAPR